MNQTTSIANASSDFATWRDYLELCKPRVVMLMILTTIVGMCLATTDFVPWPIFIFGNAGIALAACSAAIINHLLEKKIDQLMQRTKRRPIAKGKISPRTATLFALILCILSMLLLIAFVNILTALLTFLTLIGYAGIYTIYLKHATPQNIVIGGLAGAAPPLLGWVAVTGHIDPASLLLTLIIFTWTPPHFWALAIYRVEDYAKANIPMLPNTHGIPYTKLNILFYTLLLSAVSLLPFVVSMSHWIYLIATILLNIGFLYWAIRLKISDDNRIAMSTFRYSIWYLMSLFAALLIDHYFYIFK